MQVRIAAAALTALVASVPAQDRAWTVEDVVTQESATGWELDRPGTRALWLRLRADTKKDTRVATLMLTDLATGVHRELTVGTDGLSSPAFAPDGRRIAYLTSAAFPDGIDAPAEEERGQQVWLLDLGGGAPRPVTSSPFGVGAFRWVDDDALLVSARERRSPRERDAHQAKDRSEVVEDPELFRHGARALFRLDLASGAMRRVTGVDRDDSVGRFEVADGGRFALALHEIHPSQEAERRFPPRLVLHDLVQHTARELLADQRSKPVDFGWFDDHRALLRVPRASVAGEDWGAVIEVQELAIGDGEVQFRDVDLGSDRGLDGAVHATAGGFVAGIADGVRPKFAFFARDADGGYQRRDLAIDGDLPLHDLTLARDAGIAVGVVGDASTPDRVLFARLQPTSPERAILTGTRELYRPNEGFAKVRHARTEVVHFAGAHGDEVEGIVYYPTDGWREGDRRPLVLVTHGGPHAHDSDRFTERWSNAPNLIAGRGAFVLKVNYHGSSGYGLGFGESIRGRYYELELIDLFSGIRHLVDRGLVDEDRLALCGWSNGAILSIAALTHGDQLAPGFDYRFAACVPGAGDVNWTSDYGNCEFGASFDEFYVGGTPWTNPDGYIAKSPLFRLEKVTTPTLVFFGTDDRAVPTEQGWQLFRGLHRIGRAPVRFLLFPGEPHGLRKLSHQRRKLVEELAWLDEHLFDAVETARIVPDGAPLEVAEALARAPRRADGAFGETFDGLLVPETVSVAGPDGSSRRIGRFEVTRAQWREFRADGVPADRPNAPVIGVTADDARAYCAFLSERTGVRFRLPTTAEFDALPRGPAEHDLERAAGFAPAPREAAILADRVRALGAAAVLDVGSRPPAVHRTGRDRVLIFDVGGNAAEWTTTEDGPRACGGCVATPADDRADGAPPPAAFVGLRVVAETTGGS